MLGPLDYLEEIAFVVLQLLGSLECIVELLTAVPAGVRLGLRGQLSDSPLVFSGGSVKPFQAGINCDHLVAQSRPE